MTTAADVAADRLEELMDEAQVNPAQRFEFRSRPPLAVELLEYALSRRKIRNPAAFAVARFRAKIGEELRKVRAELPEPTPLEELERGLEFARQYGMPSAALEAIEAELAEARARVE